MGLCLCPNSPKCIYEICEIFKILTTPQKLEKKKGNGKDKNKVGIMWGQVAILDTLASKDLSEKVAFEERFDGSKGVNH